MNTQSLIEDALDWACPVNAERDHASHRACTIIQRLVVKIIELDTENQNLAGILMGPYVNVNESHVEEVDTALAAHIGRLDRESLQALLPVGKSESHSFDALWWAGLV